MKVVPRVAIGAVVLVAIGLVWFYSQGSAEPTADVTAPPVETTAAESPTTAPTDSTQPPGTTVPTGVFELTGESTATFELDEELRGSPRHVVGTSSMVLGQIVFDPADLSSAAIGTILVNARDFTTDAGNRDRAVRGPILDTAVHEFIEFTPTSLDGLPDSVSIGESIDFQVSGDLKIRDIVNPVTFDVSVALVSERRIEGTAITVVLRSDFDLRIPSVPSVANVTDEVTLTLDFVAEPA